MFDYRAKIAVVTGGAAGIGAATALQLGRAGAHVVILDKISAKEMMPVCATISMSGGTAQAESIDVTDEVAVAQTISDILERHGRIDFLVNSAGVYDMRPLSSSSLETMRMLFEINLLGTINMIAHTLPAMRAQRSGAIVNVASAAGVLGQGGAAAYSASKAAVINFTQTMVGELAGSRVRINVVAPGAIRTQMTAIVHDPQSAEMREALKRATDRSPSPFGVPFMEPQDIASIIAFLLSDAARAIHGACIVADQGLTAAMPALA